MTGLTDSTVIVRLLVLATVVMAASACGGGGGENGGSAPTNQAPVSSSSSSAGGGAVSSSSSSSSGTGISSSSSSSSGGALITDPLYRPEAPMPTVIGGIATHFWMRTDEERYEYLTANQLYSIHTTDSTIFGKYFHGGPITFESWKIVDNYAFFTLYPVKELPFLSDTPTNTIVMDAHELSSGKFIQELASIPNPGGFPTMILGANGRGCHGSGAMIIHEADFDKSAGNINKFSADFSYRCAPNDPLIKGAIRHLSSTDLVLSDIFVVPGKDKIALEGRQLILDGSYSWSPAAKIVSYSWSQISGPPIDLSSCQAAVCKTYTPIVAAGGATAVLALTVKTSSGLTSSRNVSVVIKSHKDRQNRVEIFGNGYVAGGTTIHANEGNSVIKAKRKWADNPPLGLDGNEVPDAQQVEQMVLNFETHSGRRYINGDMKFAFPKGQPMSPGQYFPNARGGFYPADGLFSFDFGFGGRGCGSGGNVNEVNLAKIERDPQDLRKINELGLWFESRCAELLIPELDASYGIVWINYQPTGSPVAVISGPQEATPGEEVTLSASGSHDENGSIRLLLWRDMLGVAPGSFGKTVYAWKFKIPDQAVKGQKFIRSVEVLDNSGNTSAAIHTITVK